MKKVLLSLSENFIEAIDLHCKKYNFERSEFIRQAIREVIYPKDISLKTNGEKMEKIIEEVAGDENGGAALGKVPERTKGWCQLHFEKGVEYPLRKVTYEDENGNPIVKEKWACDKCIEGLENKGVGKVYVL